MGFHILIIFLAKVMISTAEISSGLEDHNNCDSIIVGGQGSSNGKYYLGFAYLVSLLLPSNYRYGKK